MATIDTAPYQAFGIYPTTKGTTNPAAPPIRVVALADGEGNLLALGAGGTLPTASGSGPTTSLNALTATRPGTSVDLGVIRAVHAMQTTVTGSPSAGTVNLEGSLNGSAWVTLASSTAVIASAQ